VRCKATDGGEGDEGQNYVWHETKVAALYETEQVTSSRKPGETEIRAKDIEYYADMSDAQHFARLVWLKAYERGGSHAAEVILLGDGAPWIWLRLGLIFPQAIQILGWHHAEDDVIQVAQAVFGPGTQAGAVWLKIAPLQPGRPAPPQASGAVQVVVAPAGQLSGGRNQAG